MDEDLERMAGGDGVSIHTGFPNPAADQAKRRQPLALDINKLLIHHPSSTYLFRISGHQWADDGIYDGDIAIIDRFLQPTRHDIVMGWEASGFHLYRFGSASSDQEQWGVVSAIIHEYRRAPR